MKQATYTLLFIALFSSAASAACFYLASNYKSLYTGAKHEAITQNIKSEGDIKKLKEMAIFMHEGYKSALKDHASMYSSLTEIFGVLAFLCAIALIASYKNYASNKSLNSDAEKRRAR